MNSLTCNNYINIYNTDLSPDEVVEFIKEKYQL